MIRNSVNSTNEVLTRERLRQIVPSVFTMEKKNSLSDRYTFIPTYEVLNVLESIGWLPTKANEMKCRDHQNREYTKHMLRFQNFDERLRENLFVGGSEQSLSCVEMILINAHNGLASYRFLAGIFRFVCSNGMIIPEAMFGEINIRHNSYEAGKVIDISAQITRKTPEIASSVNDMRQISLTQNEKIAYAEGAKLIRFPDKAGDVENYEVLRPRRSADRQDDLWTTFNVVQENLVKGHIRQKSQDQFGRTQIRRTREIKAIDKDVKVNQALYAYTKKIAELKQNEL